MFSLLIVKSVFLILCMNEMEQFYIGERFETDTGECDYDGDGKLTLHFAYVQH